MSTQNYNRILKGFDMLRPFPFMDAVRRCIFEWPQTVGIFADALSEGQIKSKQWLMNELEVLDLPMGTVVVCAGWYGTLSYLLLEDSKLDIERIVSVDIDPSCEPIAEKLNLEYVVDGWRFKAVTKDIMHIDYKSDKLEMWAKGKNEFIPVTIVPDTIINTSCEHLDHFARWYKKIPKGKLVVLQGNDLEIPEHVNRFRNLDDFESKTPMSKVLFSGELQFDMYTRFMRIGIK